MGEGVVLMDQLMVGIKPPQSNQPIYEASE